MMSIDASQAASNAVGAIIICLFLLGLLLVFK